MSFLTPISGILMHYETSPRCSEQNKNICGSKEEAEAFLALMQLRQLRKAWVGDWTPNGRDNFYAISYDIFWQRNIIKLFTYGSRTMSFPTIKMAKEFLECFKDLCETAKILL